MLDYILLMIGALMMGFWGVAHIFPTRNVVKGFGDISNDNKYIITMEWVVEGLSFIFIAVLVASMTLINGPDGKGSLVAYIVSVSGIAVFAVWTLLTGAKVKMLPFKLCPMILTIAGTVILIGALV